MQQRYDTPPRGFPSEEAEESAFHEAKAAPRDAQGNSVGRTIHFGTPVTEDMPLKSVLNPKLYALLEDKCLLQFAKAEHYHDHILLPLLRIFRRVHKEEEHELQDHNAKVVAENARLEAQQQDLRTEWITETASLTERLTTVQQDLLAAEKVAAETVAEAGGYYDPRNPSEACLFPDASGANPSGDLNASQASPPSWAERLKSGAASGLKGAAQSGLKMVAPRWLKRLLPRLFSPKPAGPAAVQTGQKGPTRSLASMAQVPAALGWLLTFGQGVMIGLSLALLARVLERSTLGRHPVELLLFSLIGFASAIGTRFALSQAWNLAGRHEVEGASRERFVSKVIGTAITVLVMLTDGFVEQAGLLKMAQSGDVIYILRGGAAPSTGSPAQFFLAGIVVVLGFALYYSFAGYKSGKNEAKSEQAASARQAALEAQGFGGLGTSVMEDPRRQAPKVQAALNAIATVRILMELRDDLKAQIQSLADAYKAAVTQLETRKREALLTLPLASQHRIDDAVENARGAQGLFDAMFEDALNACRVRGAR